MKCKHCGREIGLNSYYCEFCGKPNEPLGVKMSVFLHTMGRKMISLHKQYKWLLPSVVGVIIIAIVISSIVNHEKTLDFTDYVIVEVSGTSGNGSLDISMDYDKMAEDVLGKSPDANSKRQYEEYLQYNTEKEELRYLVFADSDKYYDLKNGDYFLVTVVVEDSPIFRQNKISLKENVYTKTYEVGEDTEKLSSNETTETQ